MTEPGPAIPPDGNEGQASQERLRADIERTREEFGETVDALADRLDVKTRVKEGAAGGLRSARQAGTRAGQQAKRLGTEARQTTAEADTPTLVRRGGAIVVVATAGGLAAVWLRRRAARRRTLWQRAMCGVARAGADVGDRLRDQAQGLISMARESEVAGKAVDRSKVAADTTTSRAREAADSPAAGAGATIAGLLLLSLLRRRLATPRTVVMVSEGATPPSPQIPP